VNIAGDAYLRHGHDYKLATLGDVKINEGSHIRTLERLQKIYQLLKCPYCLQLFICFGEVRL